MNDKSIAIIGAGISGLACAARLTEAGFNPIVFDKGRGIGGRLATRRAEPGLQFDHGAQYFTARTKAFESVIGRAQNAGMVGEWKFGSRPRWVGIPGMNGLAKFLAEGLIVHQGAYVSGVRKVDGGWAFTVGTEVQVAAKIVITVPAPQIGAMLDDPNPFAKALNDVEMLPCLSLMVAFETERRAPLIARRDTEDALSWIALDSSKPGRTTRNCWVAQASPAWSATHLEAEPSEIAVRMLPMICDRLGYSVSDAVHAVAHRWRYAAVSRPLGRPFLKNQEGSLYLGGDWCLDARVEAAWTSGNAIATDLLGDM